MNALLEQADSLSKRAREIVIDTQLEDIWRSVNAEPHLVGSLSMGLMMKHRDIDFHIYSSPLILKESFAAISRLAENKSITRIEFLNLLETEEKCVEWHAWYSDTRGDEWQIDMIHIVKGSEYDGFAEKLVERIKAVMTDKDRHIILKLKYDTPDTDVVKGIEYYMAVIRDGIKDYKDFVAWRKNHPVEGVLRWTP